MATHSHAQPSPSRRYGTDALAAPPKRLAVVRTGALVVLLTGMMLALGAQTAGAKPKPPTDVVTGASLQLSSYATSATEVTYTTSFIATDGLTSGHSTVTLAAPSGTVFTGSGYTCSVIWIYDRTSGAGTNCNTTTLSNSGATATVLLNASVSAGDAVTLVVTGVQNDSSAASQSLQLSTSSDPVAVTLPFTLSSSGKIGSPSLEESSYTAGATGVTYRSSFVATDGLTANASAIILAAPTGTVFAGSGYNCDINYVYDDTSGAGTNCDTATLSNGSATISFSPTFNVAAGDQVTVVLTGVTNASANGTLDVSTSSDPSPQALTTGAPAAGPTSLQLSSLTPSASTVRYVTSFTSTHGLTSGSSTITLTAPAGTDFVNSGGCPVQVTDDSSASTSCATTSGAGSATIVATDPVTVSAHDVVSVVAQDVTNDSSATAQAMGVSDSADGALGTPSFTLSSHGAVSDLAMSPNDKTHSTAAATYSYTFVATDGISDAYSTIAFAAPSGTTFPGSAAGCVYEVVDDDTQSSGCVTATSASPGNSVSQVSPITVSAGDAVTVTVADVGNDSNTASQDTTLSTTTDPTAVSAAYALSSKGKVSGAGIELSSYAEHATNVDYTVTFESTDGLTAGFSTITLKASTGTVFAPTGYSCDNYYITDELTGSNTNCMTVSITGSTIILTDPLHVAPGDPVALTVDGVTNPSSKSGSIGLSTSSDPVNDILKYKLR